jgi:hypothetical protein
LIFLYLTLLDLLFCVHAFKYAEPIDAMENNISDEERDNS